MCGQETIKLLIRLLQDRPNANAFGLRDGGGENHLPEKSHRGR